jgi:hypothetical protein
MDSITKEAVFAAHGKSCVSVYSNEKEGAVIALYGERKTHGGLPAVAISVAPDGIARLQVATEEGVTLIDLAAALKGIGAIVQSGHSIQIGTPRTQE